MYCSRVRDDACLRGNSNGRRGMVTRDDEEANTSPTTYPEV